MKTFGNKTLIGQIEEVLVFSKHLQQGSAITQALAYVIFNSHHIRLVNHYGDWPSMCTAVTDEIVSQAACFIVCELRQNCIPPEAWRGLVS